MKTIINEMKRFHESVHMKILTGMQSSRNGGSGTGQFLLDRLDWSRVPSLVICVFSCFCSIGPVLRVIVLLEGEPSPPV
jgi:hypothetical protein